MSSFLKGSGILAPLYDGAPCRGIVALARAPQGPMRLLTSCYYYLYFAHYKMVKSTNLRPPLAPVPDRHGIWKLQLCVLQMKLLALLALVLQACRAAGRQCEISSMCSEPRFFSGEISTCECLTCTACAMCMNRMKADRVMRSQQRRCMLWQVPLRPAPLSPA